MDNDIIITKIPTLSVPEKLSKAELIVQCNYLQDEARKLSLQNHELKTKLLEAVGIVNREYAILAALADSYDAGDQAAILLQIKQLSDRRSSFKKSGGGLH